MESNEAYLFLYVYSIEGHIYHYFWYYKDRQEAEDHINSINKYAPHIHSISLKECENGLHWNGQYSPHKKSEFERVIAERDGYGN